MRNYRHLLFGGDVCGDEGGKRACALHQLSVAAHLRHSTLLAKHHDRVALRQHRDGVGHQDSGAIAQQPARSDHAVEDVFADMSVHSRQRIVQEVDVGLCEASPSQADLRGETGRR